MRKQRIAIIGGGIAGLTAAYLLHPKHDIRLFEKSHRLGGNAYTHTLPSGEQIDIAACVFGFRDGNLLDLLDHVGIKVIRPAASFVSLRNLDDGEGLYIDFSPRALLAQRLELLHPKKLWSLWSFYWGVQRGLRARARGEFRDLNMRQALQGLGLEGDAHRVVMFGLCLLSSMSHSEILEAPAEFFFDKIKALRNPYSLRVLYTLRCAEGNTVSYVNALAAGFLDKVVLSSRIESVSRGARGVTLRFEGGEGQDFDSVVFACNADQALALLEDPTTDEQRLLGSWSYKNGLVVVHNDHSAFPPKELCQGFTFLYREHEGETETSVNGACWVLPGVSKSCDYFGSQHPNFPIREECIDHKVVFRTPIFDKRSTATIAELPSLNGKQGTYFCGSHFGHGLHDDAVTSAFEVARLLGGELRQRMGWRSAVRAAARRVLEKRNESPTMERSLVGKTVLLTGAAGGIGRALAKRLSQDQGASLILVDRDAEGLSALERALDAPDRVQSHVVELASAVAIESCRSSTGTIRHSTSCSQPRVVP